MRKTKLRSTPAGLRLKRVISSTVNDPIRMRVLRPRPPQSQLHSMDRSTVASKQPRVPHMVVSKHMASLCTEVSKRRENLRTAARRCQGRRLKDELEVN